MRPFSGLGIGLLLVFGCLVFALIGELYYLWWKKRNSRRTRGIEVEDEYKNYVKELTHLFCWKTSTPLHPTAAANGSNQDSVNANGDLESNQELGSKDLLLKAFGGEEGVEAELMRLHNLAGPPRFLFTIKEESKEDLESEDGRRSRAGSFMSDVVLTIDTPIPSPMASPISKAPYNPFFESSTEAELNMLRASPPPKFKFLRDAEEKLLRKLMEEAEKRLQINSDSGNSVTGKPSKVADVTQGSFLKFIIGKNNEPLQYFPHHPPSTSSQDKVPGFKAIWQNTTD